MSRALRVAAVLSVAVAAHSAVNARLLRRPGPAAAADRRVSVLVPARDEAHTIGDCVRALLRQDLMELLVLDDGSTDTTAQRAGEAGAGDPRLRVITGAGLPPGWLGKPHACAQLAAAADPAADVLAFVDADVVLAPGGLGRAAAMLDTYRLDLVSPQPLQVAVGPAERLVQPLLHWSILATLPLRLAERSRRASLAAANGQFMLVRRIAYESAGGHAAVRDAVLDDIHLARAVRRTGGRGAIVDGHELASCRMYRSWDGLRDGYGRWLWTAFGGGPGALAVAAGAAFVNVAPAVAALRGSRAGWVGYLAGVASRVISARATGGRAWPDPLAHPVSVAAFDYLVLRSLLGRRGGTLRWKGRPL